MKITLYNGDCLDRMREIPDGSVDAVITDIPYGEVNRSSNGLRNLDKGVADIVSFDICELTKTLCKKSNGSVYIFCGIEQVSFIRKTMVDVGMSTRVIVWEKTNPSPMNGNRIWLSGIELCVFGKHKCGVFNAHCRNSVLRHPCGKHELHPTQKPLSLMEDIITVSTNEGQTVLDPFMGSGTTGVACVNTNRNFIGIEKDDRYFAVAKKRIESANNAPKQQELSL